MVLLGAVTNLAASRSRGSKDGIRLLEVFDSRTIHLRLPAISLEVSLGTASGDSSGYMLDANSSSLRGTNVLIGPYIGPWFHRNIISYLAIITDIPSRVSNIRQVLREI